MTTPLAARRATTASPRDPTEPAAGVRITASPRRNASTRRVDEFFDRQHTARELLPDPGPFIVNLTRYVVEILAGARDLEQIARWVDPEAYASLLHEVVVTTRARQVKRIAPSWPRYQLGSVRIESPADGIIECVTVIHRPARAGAIAMRLIGLDGRWRAARVDVI